MEKISSILPSNARVKSVDLSEAQPVRPGAPSRGQKEGSTSIRDRITLSSDAKEQAARETMMGRNPREVSRAKMVEEINKKFFETRLTPTEKTPTMRDRVLEQETEAPAQQEVKTYEPDIEKAIADLNNLKELDLEA